MLIARKGSGQDSSIKEGWAELFSEVNMSGRLCSWANGTFCLASVRSVNGQRLAVLAKGAVDKHGERLERTRPRVDRLSNLDKVLLVGVGGVVLDGTQTRCGWGGGSWVEYPGTLVHSLIPCPTGTSRSERLI